MGIETDGRPVAPTRSRRPSASALGAAVLFVLAARPVVQTLTLTTVDVIVALWLLLFVFGFLLSMIEAAAFTAGPSPVDARQVLGAMVGSGAVAAVAGLLMRTPTDVSLVANVHAWIDRYGAANLLFRLTGTAVAFMVAYCVIGSATWPFVRRFYTDPSFGLRLQVPRGPVIIALQLARGVLAALALVPLLASTSAHGLDWWRRFGLVLAVTSGVIPLLLASGWPSGCASCTRSRSSSSRSSTPSRCGRSSASDMSSGDGFAGRVAVVTGGASGLGRGLCTELSRRGAKVVIADINLTGAQELARALSSSAGEVCAEHVDVTDPRSVDALIERSVEHYGRIDFMFNNAGIAVGGEFQDVSTDAVRRVVEINLLGSAYGTLSAYRRMRAQGAGQIVNIASMYALVPGPMQSAYVAAKHGLGGLTQSVMAEAEGSGVSLTLICPGYIATNLFAAGTYGGNLTAEQVLQRLPFKLIDVATAVGAPPVFTRYRRPDFSSV
jgi:NAD(P)-dependent dehydrogenase (short-subunit alcohol dehydrogenase family)